MLFFDSSGEPSCLNIILLNAGILQRLNEGLDHQVFGIIVPTLAKLSAAHAQNRDLILDSRSHVRRLLT